MVAAPASGDAELGDVGDVVGYTGAENHADNGSGAGVAEDPRISSVKDAAAGKAHDVVQKTERAVERTILVVDEGIDVAGVRLVDKLGGELVVVGGPAADLDVLWKAERGTGCGGSRRLEVVLHEEARVEGEACLAEALVDRASVVDEKLRLDAVNAGRVQQQVEK